MSLQEVKTLVKGDEAQLNTIYNQTSKRLLNKLKRSLPDTMAIPDELDYIVDEVTIARFNRIGSEGMSSESVEGRSANYNDNYFADFAEDIQGYIDSKDELDPTEKRGRFTFI